jgi:hypothetical protein
VSPFEFEKKLLALEGGDELVSEFNEIVAEAEEEAEEEGYNLGLKDAYKEGDLSEEKEDKLRERFHYLRLGGVWDKVDDTTAPNDYARGFLDAMKTIGVKS